jgi:putative transposase
MLKMLVETSGNSRNKRKRVSPGQMQLPFAFDLRLNQIPEERRQISVRLRRANGIRDGDRARSVW